MAGQRERRSTVTIGDASELNETARVVSGRLWVDVISGPVGGGSTQYAEDTLHVSGDQVTMAGVVQQAADAALSGDGDRSILQVDETGYLKVNVKTGGTGGTQYAEDTAHVSGDTLTLAGVVQQAADAALSSDGDRSLLQVDASGWVKANIKTSVLPTGAATSANQLPNSHDVTVDNAAGAAAVNVQDGGNSLTVDNLVLSVVGGGLEATAQRVTIASDSTGVLSVDDNGASLTVDGTVAATQSGTWNINNVSGTVSLPTGAATSANQATEITSLQLIDDTVYTDDTSTHATGTSKGLLVMAAATPTDTAVNANDIGAVAMTVNRQLHVSVQEVIPGFGATNLGKREDDPHTSLDVGIMALGIRDDTLDVRSGAENDYEPFHMTSTGRLYTSATVDAALPAGTNNIGDVDIISLPNEGQQTMANSISVAIASDQAAYYFVTTLTNVNTKFDDSPTSATSGAFTVTPFRKFMFSYEVIKSAGTPTDIQFFVQYNNGGTWVDYRNNFWGQLLYDDVATTSKLARAHSGDCVGTQMRVKVVATGTAAGAHFTVTNARVECKN